MNAVIQTIHTQFERDILLNFLDQLEQLNHTVGGDVKNDILTNAPFHTRENLLAYLEPELTNHDSESLKKKLIDIRNELKLLSTVTLTVAFKPDEELNDFLSGQALQIGQKKVLFEVKYNEGIGAGAIVEGNGKISTYTLANYFNERKESYGF